MTYYKTWQEALLDFIKIYGHNYADSYNLMVEFESYLNKNKRGTWFIYHQGVTKG